MSSVTGGLEAVHHHAERVADQNDVAMLVGQRRGVGVIRGENDDRLAALARENIRCGQPLHDTLYRHCYLPKTGTPMTTGWKT
jgi:hypothetical protein